MDPFLFTRILGLFQQNPAAAADAASKAGIPPPPIADQTPVGTKGDAFAPISSIPGTSVQTPQPTNPIVQATTPLEAQGAELPNPTVPADPFTPLPNNTKPVVPDQPAASPQPATASSIGDRFVNAMKGVKAPAAPETQKVGSPAAPRPTAAIKGGELLALLQMLGASAGQQQPGMRLPSTLGQALGGR